jgi:hypothetical protein
MSSGRRLMASNRLLGLAWLPAATCVLLVAAALILMVLQAGHANGGDEPGLSDVASLALLLAALAFATVGALVAARLPENPMGWIFAVMGLLLGVGVCAWQYANYGLSGASGPLRGIAVAAATGNIALTPVYGLLGVSLLLFPNGRLPSRRWGSALIVAGAGTACITSGYAIRPGPLDAPFDSIANPFGIDGAFALADTLVGFGWIFTASGVALAAIAMVGRLRRSRGSERQQLKWIALAAAVTGVVMVSNFASYAAGVEGIEPLRVAAVALSFSLFPLAAGTAILRHRLYDIDLVINRALVYGALTLILGATYLGLVLGIGLAVGRSGLAVAASTLAVAVLFRPARARIQAVVDRRFYRRRYDAAQTLEAFGLRLRDEVDLAALGIELRGVVRETMQPAHSSLWLRERER